MRKRLLVVLALAACGNVTPADMDATGVIDAANSVDGSGSVDGPGAADAANPPDAGAPDAPTCDPNEDGLVDNPTCITAPAYLRFVNASGDTFAVDCGGRNRVATLAPGDVFIVGPVQAGLTPYSFVGPATVSNEVLTTMDKRYAIVVWKDPATGGFGASSGEQFQPGGCGTGSAQHTDGQFTSLTPNPVPLYYSTTGAAPYSLLVSPGLNAGQIFGSGCFTTSFTFHFAAGAPQTAPQFLYQSMTFTSGLTYMIFFRDSEIIRIDNLDRVMRFPRL